MAAEEKTIHDPIHGSMRLSGLILDLLGTPELQRLRSIRQLGLSYLAFPGANHSRFEHALGVANLVKRFNEDAQLKKDELNLLLATALLHDIGHPPYSHTLEYLMMEYLNKNHEQIAGDMLDGKLNPYTKEDFEQLRGFGISTAGEVLEKHGLDPKEVALLILGKHGKPYLKQLIHGEIDLDQMDYLLRDAHFTGVALGMIDLARLMRVLLVRRGCLTISHNGIEAVEGFLTARALMYTSVYFHHTVRVAELMLANAVEFAIRQNKHVKENFHLMTDSELFERLYSMGGYPQEIVTRLKYRQLFKTAYIKKRRELTTSERRKLLKQYGRWGLLQVAQDKIAEAAGVPRGYVVLDVPIVELLVSEPRLQKVEVPVLLDGRLVELSKLSSIATALKKRYAPRHLLQVVTLPKYIKKVNRAAKNILD